jgi:hypothetical protein
VRVRSVLLAAAAAALLSPAPAAGAAPACGDVVVADVVLEADLTGCETGLVVGADGVTIDLNGHSIEGQSVLLGSGIEAIARSGITVKNGRISGFSTGVRLFDTSASSVEDLVVGDTDTAIAVGSGGAGLGHSNRIVRNRVSASRTGILMAGPDTRVLENQLSDLESIGISCRWGGHVQGNRVAAAEIGIALLFCGADVVRNETTENRSVGILRVRSTGLVAMNRANHNGSGIVSDDSHGVHTRNVTNNNVGNGLTIVDQIDSHGPAHTVEDHVAMANGGLGISANVLGVVQLGKNRARANGDPRECVNITCN